jgi:hypothetical protein
MARLEVFAGRLEQARELLMPLVTPRRMRVAEFVALATAKIDLALAEDDIEEAHNWAGMWEALLPEHPQLAAMRRRIEDASP